MDGDDGTAQDGGGAADEGQDSGGGGGTSGTSGMSDADFKRIMEGQEGALSGDDDDADDDSGGDDKAEKDDEKEEKSEKSDDDGDDEEDGEDDGKPKRGMTVDGKKYTYAQVEAAIQEREKSSQSLRAVSSQRRQVADMTKELEAARAVNDTMRKQFGDHLAKGRIDLGNMDFANDPRFAGMEPAQINQYLSQAAAHNAAIEKMIGEVDGFTNAKPGMAMNEANVRAGMKRGQQMAMSAFVEDPIFDTIVSDTGYEEFVKDSVKIFETYGIGRDEAVSQIILNPDPRMLSIAKDLVEFSKLKGKKAEAQKKAAKKTAKTSSDKGAAKTGKAKGPPKSDAEFNRRVAFMDQVEGRMAKMGRSLDGYARSAYINEGVPIRNQ